jgi:2-oxoglutarate ferredoxin oxidoreductase subunit delta
VIYIDEEFCKGCRICSEFCPTGVLGVSTTLNRKGYYPPVVEQEYECHGCRLCELLCPEFAIFIVNEVRRADRPLPGEIGGAGAFHSG